MNRFNLKHLQTCGTERDQQIALNWVVIESFQQPSHQAISFGYGEAAIIVVLIDFDPVLVPLTCDVCRAGLTLGIK